MKPHPLDTPQGKHYSMEALRTMFQVPKIRELCLIQQTRNSRLSSSEREKSCNMNSAAIIKIGGHFAKLRRVLDELRLLDNAVYVERATLPNQRIAPLAEIDPATVPYFAMALVCRGEAVR